MLTIELDSIKADLEATPAHFRAWLIHYDTLATHYISSCRSERHDLRRQIRQATGDGQISFSPLVLNYRLYKERYAELYWSEIRYYRGQHKGRARRLDGNRVGGGTNLAELRAGAHPMEVDMLKRHEAGARVFRRVWQDFVDARRRTEVFLKTVTKLTDLSLPAGVSVHEGHSRVHFFDEAGRATTEAPSSLTG